MKPFGVAVMKVSTKARIATAALVELGMHRAASPARLADIAATLRVSLSHLEHLFGLLRRHELVEGFRGPGGGYVLARSACDISVGDVVYCVDQLDQVTTTAERDEAQTPGAQVWEQLRAQAMDYLDTVSLAQLIDDVRAARQTPTRPIVTGSPRVAGLSDALRQS
jgi:Rrf2 family iron-sulfur cluster assembly transcriptional regulator